MSTLDNLPPMGSENARAPVIGSSRICPACQKPLQGRQELACSGKCRAALSRRRRQEAQAQRERRLRELLEEALRFL